MMKIKKTIAFIAALCISSSVLGTAVYADNEVTAVVQEAESIEYSSGYYISGNFQYTLSNTGEATITKYLGSEKNVVFPSVIDGYPVVAIGVKWDYYNWTYARLNNNYVFSNWENVVSVVIPEGVTRIDGLCGSCPNLTNVVLPSTLKSINYYSFFGCKKLEKISIPENVSFICSSAFEDCISLKEIKLPANLKKINSRTFADCVNLINVVLPEELESIENFAFGGCKKLSSISMPNTVISIGDEAFDGCENLVSVIFSSSLKSIGSGAFRNCKSLKEVILPDNIESIDGEMYYSETRGAFQNCTSLINVKLPSNIKNISSNMFSNCENLTEVIVPPDVTKIVPNAFTNCKKAMICYPRSASLSSPLSNVGAAITYMISDDKAIITGVSSELDVITIPGNIYGYPVVDFIAQFNGRVNHTHYPSAEDCVICPKVATPMEKFVERLYTVILNRNSDSEGKNNHVSNLENGESACKVAYDFIFSNEFLNSGLSNEEVVAKMYRVFLDREPDAGSKTWVDALNNGCSYAAVMYGVSQSNEFTEICDKYGIVRGNFVVSENRDQSANLTAFVNRLYNKTLGRNGEPEGLNSHTGAYLQDRNVERLAYNFVFSPEFTNKNHSNEEFVEIMYQAFFGRDSDPTGREHWLGVLANGGSRYDVFLGFIGSQECKELVESFGI